MPSLLSPSLLAAAAEGAAHASPGFFTRNVWLFLLLPIVSFVATLAVGKRTPGRGQEIGLACIGLSLLLSVGLGVEWFGRHHANLAESSPAAITAITPGTDLGGTVRPSAEVIEERAEAREAAHAAHRAAHGGVEPPTEPLHVRPAHEKEVSWWSSAGNTIGFGLRVDGFTVAMLFTVAAISFLVHLYSTAYMEDDSRKVHYFAALGLFTGGMYLLVTASTTLAMLVGWEIMGLCSFMLIGHWWEKGANTNAALKAFFTTRTGDVGLLVGVTILFFGAGQTFNIGRINQLAILGMIPRGWLIAAAVALFIACIGKSAQFPLHTWLPDAMAGPTPASSLIHAATMVVAGVYMVARLYPVFFEAFSITQSPWNPIAIIGATTVLIAGGLAFVQPDIKKVLAYSTVSQLGYMVLGLGVGAWTGAIFHLFTHAFFKCLLFQSAGAISHSCYHSFDMRDYGGLRKLLPRTHAVFAIGTIALMGLPPLAGFFSKDEILLGAWSNGYKPFFWIGCIGAAMTCGYMTRVYFKTFLGEHHGPQTPEAVEHHAHAHHDEAHHEDAHGGHDDHGHASHGAGSRWGLHESPRRMMVPLYVLAVMSCIAGVINAPGLLQFTHFTAIESIVGAGVPEPHFNAFVAVVSTAFGVGGLALGVLFMSGRLPFLVGLTERNRVARAGYRFLENKYYLDKLYEQGVVYAVKKPLAAAAYWVNQHVLDGAVNGSAVAARRSAKFVYDSIDQPVVDGTVNGAAWSANGLGRGLKLLASGNVQQYAAILLGASAFGAVVLAFVN